MEKNNDIQKLEKKVLDLNDSNDSQKQCDKKIICNICGATNDYFVGFCKKCSNLLFLEEVKIENGKFER